MADDISDLILREGEKPAPVPPSLSGREPSTTKIQVRGDIGDLVRGPTEFADVAAEYGKGLVQGFVGETPAAAGAYGGARAGFQLGSRVPFAQPTSTIVGTLGGGLVGMISGSMAGEPLAKKLYDEQTNPDLKPFREAGKTTGGGLAFLPLGYTINPNTGVRVLDFLGKVGEFARKHPILYASAEGSAAASSGVFGGIAEGLYPGEPGPRFTGEVIGGLLSIPNLVNVVGVPGVGLIRNAVSRFSGAQRESRAAERLSTLLQEQFEPELRKVDPDAWALKYNDEYLPRLIKELQQPGIVPGMTSAQKTGDIPLTVLETSLARQNDVFGGKVADQSIKAQANIIGLINALNKTGDPTMLQEAAQLRSLYFKNLLDGRLANADARSAVAIAGITKDSPANRMELGLTIRNNVDESLKDVREAERTLWLDVPKAIQAQVKETVASMRKQGASSDQIRAAVARLTDGQAVVASNFTKQFDTIRSEMSPEYYNHEFPAILKDIYGRLSKARNAKNLTPDQLMKFGQEANPDLYEVYQTLKRQFSTVRKGDLSYAGMKSQVDDTAKELVAAGKDFVRRGAINVGDLVNARSDLLRLAMDAEARGERANFAYYNKLAVSLLDDMEQVRNPAYDTARAFSREVNDTYTRTFAGEMRGVTKTGADRIIPEVLVSRAFSGNSDLINARMRQIQDAVDMLPRLHNQYVADFGPNDPRALLLEDAVNRAGPRAVSTADAVDRATRLAAAASIDPQTNRLNTSRLSRWLYENEALVDSIPGLRNDLENSIRAQNSLDLITKQNSSISKKIEKEVAFSKFLGENPSEAVADAINSKNPALTMRRLAQAARTGMGKGQNQDLTDALKSAVYDYAYTKAGGDKLNFKAYNDVFFAPTSTGRPALADILVDSGIMNRLELASIKKLTGELARIEAVMGNKQVLERVLETSDAVEDLVLRVVGARVGAGVAEGGSTLIAASAGSRMMRDMFDRLPNESVRGLLEQAARDPAFMVRLLQKNRTEAEKIKFAQFARGYLINAGLTAGEDEEPAVTATAPPTMAERTVARIEKKLQPLAPQTRGVPSLFSRAPQPGRPQAQTQGGQPQSQASARQLYQQLFPEPPGSISVLPR